MQTSFGRKCVPFQCALGNKLTQRKTSSRQIQQASPLPAAVPPHRVTTSKSLKGRSLICRASEDDSSPGKENVEFGYTRKDVLLIGAGLIAAGYGLYYGVQAFGVEATTAGNYVQLFVFLVICLGYISTYIFRVANKDMTYAKQLEAYEQRVMQKRLEEMPETERERLLEEVRRESGTRKGPKL